MSLFLTIGSANREAQRRFESHGAGIHPSPDERFLSPSNRGHDRIAVFAVDAGSGSLQPKAYLSSGRATPRMEIGSPACIRPFRL